MTSDPTAPPNEVAMLGVATAALWLLCVTVGVVGLFLAYPRPMAPRPQAPPVEAQLVNVQIAGAAEAPPPSPADSKPPLNPPAVALPPAAPQLIAVATPSPAIEFARPVKGPTTTVSAREAAPASSVMAQRSGAPAVQRIVFGVGAGQQPAPEYPREAALEHEEGVVLVRFAVDESGTVSSASAVEPSPFSLLNQSAVRTIRDEWRFPAGPPRLYEVSITFQLR
jgi:protein TonB